jgi:hypothetical protein
MTKKLPSVKMIKMKRLFPLALIGLGLLLIMVTAGFWSFNQKLGNPAPAPLPEVVAGLSLTEAVQGDQAIAEFSRLHGSDFPLTSGAVGMYGGNHSATLWVAGAPFKLMTGRMLAAMRDKIASTKGRSPFSPVGERQEGSRTIYELDGMGQKHFYFQSGKLIVWLAVNPERAEDVLNQVLMFYP